MANDFSGDSNCIALWKFESGALTADSKGSNTLTDNNTVGTETVDYKEGAACADFEYDNSEYLSVADADLDSGFPLKNGDVNKKISVCGWFKLESIATEMAIFAKYNAGSNKRSFQININSTPHFGFTIGYNNGESYEVLYDDVTPQTGRWYHFGATFDNSDKSWRFVVWDDTAGSKVVDASGTATNNINAEDAAVTIGGVINDVTAIYFLDGLVDEVVVFNDILSAIEIDGIRQGIFPTNINVSATCPSLTLSTHAAAIAAPINVQASSASLTIAANAATVFWGTMVSADAVSLTITPHAADIQADTNVICSPAVLTIAPNAALISYDVTVEASAESLSVATYDALVFDGEAWAKWITAHGREIVRYYYLTLTGAADGLSDLTLPMSSFQARRRSGDPTFMAAVIPGISYYDAILARSNGELIIEMAYELNGVIEYQEELVRVEYENIRYHRGGRNQSLIVEGHKTETFGNKAIDLQGVSYIRLDEGLYHYRCAAPEMYLQPGDTARYDGNEITVAEMVLSISADPPYASMEVSEEAGA